MTTVERSFAARLHDQATDDHRGPRLATVGPLSGTIERVLRRHLHRVDGHAQLLGDELRKYRLGALAHLRRGGQDADLALARQLDTDHARQMNLATAREAGAMPRERKTDARAVRSRGDFSAADFPPPELLAAACCAVHAAARSRADSFELGCLCGALEHLLAGDAFLQDLARRRLVADPVDPAPAQLERRNVERLARCD